LKAAQFLFVSVSYIILQFIRANLGAPLLFLGFWYFDSNKGWKAIGALS